MDIDQGQKILIRILAASDSVWLPHRETGRPGGTNTYFARRDFPTAGVPWASRGATELQRKQAQWALEGLVGSGEAETFRPRGARRETVKLTDAGEFHARRLVGLPSLYSAWLAALEIAEHSRRPPEVLTDRHVCEWKLIGDLTEAELSSEREFRALAMAVEDLLLSALLRGYVTSASDVRRNVSYRLSSSGWAWLDSGDAPAAESPCDEPDAEAVATYYDELSAAQHRLDTGVMRDPREIGPAPLPCSMGGLKLMDETKARV